jgi:hypothetical protein
MIKKVCIFGSYKDLSQETKEEIVRLGKMLAQPNQPAAKR